MGENKCIGLRYFGAAVETNHLNLDKAPRHHKHELRLEDHDQYSGQTSSTEGMLHGYAGPSAPESCGHQHVPLHEIEITGPVDTIQEG